MFTELRKKFLSRVVFTQQEERIKNEFNIKEQKLDVTVALLINHLSTYHIGYGFEQIYNFIFGSQVKLLNKINEFGGVAEEFLSKHHEWTKATIV